MLEESLRHLEEWLKKSNECYALRQRDRRGSVRGPVCRWELPTDDLEYEKGRVDRMTGALWWPCEWRGRAEGAFAPHRPLREVRGGA